MRLSHAMPARVSAVPVASRIPFDSRALSRGTMSATAKLTRVIGRNPRPACSGEKPNPSCSNWVK